MIAYITLDKTLEDCRILQGGIERTSFITKDYKTIRGLLRYRIAPIRRNRAVRIELFYADHPFGNPSRVIELERVK